MRAAPAVDHPIARDGFWRHACAALAGASAAVLAAWACSLVWAEGASVLTLWLPAGWLVANPDALASAGAGAKVQAVLTVLAALAVCCAGWAGACAGRRAAAGPAGSLRWDGGQWCLASERLESATPRTSQVGAPRIALDWGDRMLLRWQVTGQRDVWLPLRRADQPARWHLMRVALRHASPSAPQARADSAATRAAA